MFAPPTTTTDARLDTRIEFVLSPMCKRNKHRDCPAQNRTGERYPLGNPTAKRLTIVCRCACHYPITDEAANVCPLTGGHTSDCTTCV